MAPLLPEAGQAQLRSSRAALDRFPEKGSVPSASETRKGKDSVILKPRQLGCHSSFIPASLRVDGAVCPAGAPSFQCPVVCGACSFFGVIRFLLTKDTDSQQARAEVNRADVLVSTLPKALAVNECWPLTGVSSLHV